MKLQLFLDNREVDLFGTETFPITKSFDNTHNPTDIITEYSKSINIPISMKNNKILANSYRLDRELIIGSETNIGLYLDPNKRIPMKLIYNGSVVLDGYAKYVSSTSSQKNNHYTLNLFGILGDIFYKLKGVVVSEEWLTEDQKSEEDGGKKYILNDYSRNYKGERTVFNNDFVSTSWYTNYAEIDIEELPKDQDYYDPGIQWIYGAAPSYRGYYPGFESNRVQSSATQSVLIEDKLREAWKQKYYLNHGITKPTPAQQEAADAWVDGLDPSGLVGDGFKDYQMNEYRAYKQRPFIYFNKLLYMFKNKIEELSDYTLTLDKNWFNVTNPYWTRMCYMFDYLQKEGEASFETAPCTQYKTNTPSALSYNKTVAKVTHSLSVPLTTSSTSSTLVTNPTTLMFDVKTDENINWPEGNAELYGVTLRPQINPMYGTCFEITISAGTKSHIFYASTMALDNIKSSNWPFSTLPTKEKFLQLNYNYPVDNKPADMNYDPAKNEWCGFVKIPALAFEGDFTTNSQLEVTVVTGNKTVNQTNGALSFFNVGLWNFPEGTYRTVDIWGNDGYYNATYKIGLMETSCQKPWYNIDVGLDSFYKKEEPIFDVILQYTKMFGLHWDVDYNTKEVKLLRRETMFKDFTVENWDDKIDKTKNKIVEPVSFPTKYIKFGYDETEGYRYTAYRDKFSAEYGDKIVKTQYDFNVEETALFEGLTPTISSNRNFITYKDWLNWDTLTKITAKTDPVERLECANEEDKESIPACQWCIRDKEQELYYSNGQTIYITNDTDLMIAEGKSYYIDPKAIEDEVFSYPTVIKAYSMPVFSGVHTQAQIDFKDLDKSYSVLFNTPNIDYTTDKKYQKALGNTVYDVCWSNFINERYNSQNKKLTAFFHITSEDFSNFKFNKFVTLENQLFMVNKIFDYEPTKNVTTKCELIQITNPSNYTTPLVDFPPYIIEIDAPYVDGKYIVKAYEPNAGFIVKTISDPEMYIDIVMTSPTDQQLAYVEDAESTGGYRKIFYITCELEQIDQLKFDMVVKRGNETFTYPFVVERATTYIDDVVTNYTLNGFAFDGSTSTQKPLLGARVYQVGQPSTPTYTSSAGKFSLELKAGYPAAIVIEPTSESLETAVCTVPTSSSTGAQIFYVGSSSKATPVAIKYKIKGTVTNKNGQPLQSKIAQQDALGNQSRYVVTESDQNGNYELELDIGLNNIIYALQEDTYSTFSVPYYYIGDYIKNINITISK